MHAECNETPAAIEFEPFHADCNILTKTKANSDKNCSRIFPSSLFAFFWLVMCWCGELSCSTSSPVGYLVDGLPPAANTGAR